MPVPEADVVVAGAGHNSLVTAAYLAKAGFEVLVLEAYGLEYVRPDPVVHLPFPDGTSLTQWRDLERTCDELAKFSARDADAYRRMIADYDAAKTAFGAYRNNPVGRAPRPEGALDGRWRRGPAISPRGG